MKFIITMTFFVLFLAAEGISQEYKPAHEGWLTLLQDAHQESEATGKPIMAYFTGSDWCGPCRRLSAAVFHKDEFHQWAEENVVLLELDFPKRRSVPDEIKQQNSSLQQALKVRGYPTIWVFNLEKNDENGQFEIQALGKTGYSASYDKFTSTIEEMIQ